MADSSILTDVKKVLGIDESYEAFDLDIMMHINSIFSVLTQLGIGPEDGFLVENKDQTWGQFLELDNRFNQVKTYVYLRVRLLFDPPATSFTIAAMERQIEELGWRLNVTREGDEHPWVAPTPDPDPLPWY